MQAEGSSPSCDPANKKFFLAVTDLGYDEDSNAETDMNVVMDETGKFIEIQGTTEQQAFDRQQLDVMLELAQASIFDILKLQRQALANM